MEKNQEIKTKRANRSEKMEGFIARMYDRNAKKMQMAIYKSYVQKIITLTKEEDSILEVAPGPGYMTIELAKSGNYKIIGMDISKTFIEIAKQNAINAGVKIDFQQGSASEMPFSNECFDCIVCTAAFKNFNDPIKSLNEIFRVLKPGGFAWIDDIKHDITKSDVNELVKNTMNAKGLSAFFMKWSFNKILKKSAYTKEQLESFIQKSYFRVYEISEDSLEYQILLRK